MRYVTEFTTAKPEVAEAHFLARLSVETDCADVHDSLAYIGDDFVLLHVVGREEDFARRHIPGALHLPHKQNDRRKNGRMARRYAICGVLRGATL